MKKIMPAEFSLQFQCRARHDQKALQPNSGWRAGFLGNADRHGKLRCLWERLKSGTGSSENIRVKTHPGNLILLGVDQGKIGSKVKQVAHKTFLFSMTVFVLS